MTENLRIWDALSKTDPKQTKGFQRAGGFKGTAVKPIWTTMRLTEQFGPCGIGWGMGKPEFQTVAAHDEILVYCTVSLWYSEGEGTETGTVYGVGGDKVLTKDKNGLRTNDEAFKAAYTDALSNAMKQIGVAADVHMGLFDDHKYVREMEKEFAADAAAKPETRPEAKTTGKPFQLAIDPTPDGRSSDWETFAARLKAFFQEAVDVGELNAWVTANQAPMATLKTDAPEIHGGLQGFYKARLAALKNDPARLARAG